MSVRVKICGLKTPDTVAAAVGAGANYIGFNFFEPSPRYVAPDVARDLAFDIPLGVIKVALVVDPTLDELDAIMDIVPADMIQLHGKESPGQVVEVKARYGLPVMKAIGVADAPDLEKIDLYASVADQLLIDAKPPKNAVLPGGNGVSFDWRLISARRWSVPWMLAGGLTPENVAEAIALTGTSQVDVSSGVESAPGVKDDNLIQRFMAAC